MPRSREKIDIPIVGAPIAGPIGRRDFLRACAAVPLASAAPYLPSCMNGDRLAFRIVRKGSAIGTHILDFAPRGNGFDVTIAVDIEVKFGPIPLFHYGLQGVEQWRNGVLSHVDAKTDDDGKADFVRCARDAGGLWVTGSRAARYRAPPEALMATHWNIAEVKGPLINIQDGRLFHPIVTPHGNEKIALADGTTIPAQHFNLSGDVHLDLWYDTNQRWASVGFTASDGSLIRYERL